MADATAVAKVALDAAKEDIGKCYAALMNGYQKGDWAVTSQIYGPNCTIACPGKPTIKGRESAEAYWKALKDETGVTKIQIKCEELNGCGDWFFERGLYKLFKGETQIENRKYRYIKVWRKWEGKLCIYNYMFNREPLVAA